MSYDFSFWILTSIADKFPIEVSAWNEEEAKNVGVFGSITEIENLLSKYPGIKQNQKVWFWEDPKRGRLSIYLIRDGNTEGVTSIFVDTHARFDAILELFNFLKFYFPHVVIVDKQTGMAHDEKSFKDYFNCCPSPNGRNNLP